MIGRWGGREGCDEGCRGRGDEEVGKEAVREVGQEVEKEVG